MKITSRAHRKSSMRSRRHSLALERLEVRLALATADVFANVSRLASIETREPELAPITYVPPAESPSIATAANSAVWQQAGPGPISGGQAEGIVNNPVSGAVHTVVAHPTDANVLWVGTTNGGIWKTTNATAAAPTWTTSTDQLGSLSIGALDLDPTDAAQNTLWAGIGRNSSLNHDGGARIGLLKSTNGGASWTTVTGGNTLPGKNISGIAARGNVIVVAVNLADSFTYPNIGIFRSTNSGGSFTQISGKAGSNLPGGVTYDLVGDPTNADVLYTSVQFATNAVNGVYKSVNQGATWAHVSSPAIDALISNNTGNMELAVGKQNNVYLGILNSGVLAGVFRSGNGGTTWNQLDTPVTNENGTLVGTNPGGIDPFNAIGSPVDVAGGQGFIHFSIVADPTNPNIVYIGGDRQPSKFANGQETGQFPNSIGANNYSGRLFRVDASKAGGSQAISLTHNPTTLHNSAPHADSRELTFDANGNLIEGDDGGIYKRTNPRGVGDWFSMHGNLTNTEIHSIAYDSRSNTLIAGAQDVGTPYQATAGAANWKEYTQGDGGVVAVDSQTLAANNQSIRYTSFFNFGGFTRSVFNASGALVSATQPALTVAGSGQSLRQFDNSVQFYTPFQLNALKPAAAVIGTNNVYETVNQFGTLTLIATGDKPVTALAYGGTGNQNALYVGNEHGIFVRETAGTNFLPRLNYAGGTPTDIVLDPASWKVGFVTDSNQVFKFSGGGTTFADVTGNLTALIGSARIRTVSYIEGAATDGVVVGTDIGTFLMRLNAPSQWEAYGPNLPNAPVTDLHYDTTDDVLVAGLLGRGAWTVNAASKSIVPNLAPHLTLPATALTFTEGGAATLVGAGGTVVDADSANFAGGRLIVSISANVSVNDRLAIRNQGVGAGQIGINGSNITFAGVTIGTFIGGVGTSKLVITLNSNATSVRTQALLRNITFRTLGSNPSTLQRTLKFQMTDGDGGTSNAVTRKVNVQAIPSPPPTSLIADI